MQAKKYPKTRDGIPSPALLKMRRMSSPELEVYLDKLRQELVAKIEKNERLKKHPEVARKRLRLEKEIKHVTIVFEAGYSMLKQRQRSR